MDGNDIKGRPWAPLPKETTKAYNAFITYLELGKDRSIAKAMQAAGARPGAVRHWERWSSKYQWVDRAKAYDSDHLLDKMAGRKLAREEGRQPICDDVPDMVRELRDLSKGIVATSQQKLKLGRDGKPIKILVPDPENEGEFIEVGVTEELVPPKVRASILIELLGIAGLMKPVRQEITGADGRDLGEELYKGLANLDPEKFAALCALWGVES